MSVLVDSINIGSSPLQVETCLTDLVNSADGSKYITENNLQLKRDAFVRILESRLAYSLLEQQWTDEIIDNGGEKSPGEILKLTATHTLAELVKRAEQHLQNHDQPKLFGIDDAIVQELSENATLLQQMFMALIAS